MGRWGWRRRMIATGQWARCANSAAVDPRSCRVELFVPFDPTQMISALRETSTSSAAGSPSKIWDWILTGLPVPSTAAQALCRMCSAYA